MLDLSRKGLSLAAQEHPAAASARGSSGPMSLALDHFWDLGHAEPAVTGSARDHMDYRKVGRESWSSVAVNVLAVEFWLLAFPSLRA